MDPSICPFQGVSLPWSDTIAESMGVHCGGILAHSVYIIVMKTQNTTPTHTPTAWLDEQIVKIFGIPHRAVFGKDGNLLAYVQGNNKSKKAPELVKCINAHDELMVMLKEYADICEDDDVYPGLNEIARDILAKLKQ
jgi:hypothetical protein